MLLMAIILFLLAAIFGLIVLTAILKNQSTPKIAVVIHGTMAGIALLVLFAYVISGHTATLLITSLGLFVLAALGGLTLLTIDLRDKPIPKLLAILHPILAVTSLILLILYVLQIAH